MASTHASTQQTEASTEMIGLLQTAYRMEIESVANYLANSVHLDGVGAEEVKRALGKDVTEELGHATRLARRIKQLGGRIPGSTELEFDQYGLRPPEVTTDVSTVVDGVIAAEEMGIENYRTIINECGASDPVTSNLVTDILAEEEEHLTLFVGFRAELRQHDR